MSTLKAEELAKIKARFTDAVLFECKLDAKYESEPESVRLGAAVKEAVKAGANLAGANLAGADLAGADFAGAYLVGANLVGANLAGADLAGAYLVGANLAGANLAGANLDRVDLARAYLAGANLAGANLAGAKVHALITRVWRTIDTYEFITFATDRGVIIRAGYRNMSPTEFRLHVTNEYPGTDKAEEMLAIIDFIEVRAATMNYLASG